MIYYSEIDESQDIKEDLWALSIVRKAGNALSQHAFLVLEGVESGVRKTWFFDFVGKPPGQLLLNASYGYVRLYTSEDSSILLYSCPLRMMDLKNGDKIQSLTWGIDDEKGQSLIKFVQDEAIRTKNATIPFSILGSDSVVTGSAAASSSKDVGDSCFTWAKKRLKSCDISLNLDLSTKWLNSLLSITALNLNKKVPVSANSSLFKNPWITAASAAIATGGIIAGLALTDYSPFSSK